MANVFDASEWLDMMSDTVDVYPYLSQSVSGVPTYASLPTTYPAYIEMKNHRVIDAIGREVMAKGKVFLGVPAVIDVRSKVVLPAEYVPTSPPIISVDIANDENGNHHSVLHIGGA